MVFNVANNVVEELFLLCVNPKIIPGQPITTVVNVEANADICRMNPLINTEGFAPIRIKCFLKCSFNFFYIAASYIVKESLNDCFICPLSWANLRAAKSDAENAGIEVDGMANSVSELRSELKSLTGVDIMLDSKNFKSTYQVMKELSQVWGGLSDVTQANVTEMIGGKRNANAVSAILNNFDVAESAMESAANSANVAWEENKKWLDSIQGRLGQLDASFQVLSQDVLSSGLLKTGVSFLTSIVKLLDKIINLTGALPAGLGITAFAAQLGKPKMTGFMIVPSNTPGGNTEQVLHRYLLYHCEA